MDTKQMIPKIVHQLWIGPAKAPTELMQSWQMLGWEYKLWNEDNLPPLTNQAVYDYYYERGDYAGASDVVRYEVLHAFGGIYVDADTKRLKDIPEELLHTTLLAGYAHKSFDQPYRVATSVLGAVKHHPVLAEAIDRLGKLTELEPGWNTVGATLLTQVIIDTEPDNINIQPSYVFYPHDSKGNYHARADEALTDHLWGSRGDVY